MSKYGTPVIIFDQYAFGQRAPWKRLSQDPNAHKVSSSELEAAIAMHKPTIDERLGIGVAADTMIAAGL